MPQYSTQTAFSIPGDWPREVLQDIHAIVMALQDDDYALPAWFLKSEAADEAVRMTFAGFSGFDVILSSEGLLVEGMDCDGVEHLAEIISTVLRHHGRNDLCIAISSAHTCSDPIAEAFHGVGYFISAGKVETEGVQLWGMEKVAEFKKKTKTGGSR